MNVEELNSEAGRIYERVMEISNSLLKDEEVSEVEVDDLISQAQTLTANETVFVPEGEYSFSQLSEYLNPFSTLKSVESLLKTVKKSLRSNQ